MICSYTKMKGIICCSYIYFLVKCSPPYPKKNFIQKRLSSMFCKRNCFFLSKQYLGTQKKKIIFSKMKSVHHIFNFTFLFYLVNPSPLYNIHPFYYLLAKEWVWPSPLKISHSQILKKVFKKLP